GAPRRRPAGGRGPLGSAGRLVGFPPTTLVGLRVKPVTWSGTTVSEADCWAPPNEAVIEPETAALTVLVVTVNDTLLAPAGTVTLEGTDAAVLVLPSATAVPPAGAGPVNAPRPGGRFPPPTLARARA